MATPGRRAGVLVAAWVVGASLVGSFWAASRVEGSLEDAATHVPAIQETQGQGVSIEWNGRTAYLDPGDLDGRATDDLVAALGDLDGVRSVKLVGGASVAAGETATTSTAIPATVPTTKTPTTDAPTTTALATTAVPTTAAPTTAAPTTAAASTTAAPTTAAPGSTSPADDAALSEAGLALELVLVDQTVEFIFSTAIPTVETEALLDELAELMESYPELKLHITGHTDPVGNEVANQTLSEARAQSVANHLIIRGIDGTRMTVAGKGSTEPISDNDTLAGKQDNRRVVIEAV